MDIPVTVRGPLAAMKSLAAVAAKAAALRVKPQAWRPSEYAMTKSASRAAADGIAEVVGLADGPEAAVTLSAFDWMLLLGEIDRHGNAVANDTPSLKASCDAYFLIRDALADEALVNPHLALLLAEERAAARLEEAEAAAAAALENLRRVQGERITAMHAAGL